MENGKTGLYKNSETSEPITINIIFDVGDYISDITQHAKIQSDRPNEASGRIGEMLLSRGFIFSIFDLLPYKPQNRILHFLTLRTTTIQMQNEFITRRLVQAKKQESEAREATATGSDQHYALEKRSHLRLRFGLKRFTQVSARQLRGSATIDLFSLRKLVP